VTVRVVFIGSTGGAVLARLLRHRRVRAMVLEAVSDRACGFLQVAQAAGVSAVQLDAADGTAFSELLLQRYGQQLDGLAFLSFYTRLFRGRFVEATAGRVFNFHPSLLPAFAGMHGFEDTLASRARFMGATVHEVDAGTDTGAIVLQAALPLDRSRPVAENRHRLFLAQCTSALQLLRWLQDGRLHKGSDGHWTVQGARHAPGVFAPNLDADLFDGLDDGGGCDDLRVGLVAGA
jgi:phosphoribosylglycinamide formyltransferase 1